MLKTGKRLPAGWACWFLIRGGSHLLSGVADDAGEIAFESRESRLPVQLILTVRTFDSLPTREVRME
jgi:hypothetical protein